MKWQVNEVAIGSGKSCVLSAHARNNLIVSKGTLGGTRKGLNTLSAIRHFVYLCQSFPIHLGYSNPYRWVKADSNLAGAWWSENGRSDAYLKHVLDKIAHRLGLVLPGYG